MNHTIVRLIAAITLLSFQLFCAELPAASSTAKQLPPPGFESLNQQHSSIIDVYFQGELIVETFATFTADTVLFQNPGDILAHIPNLRDPDKVLSSLTGWLSSHPGQICHHQSQKKLRFAYA